ncbi:MAG: 2-oxoacid:ferredoxin oxidoreductase subunit beta [Ichthyobacteriaceae bacterium]|nr:2-oxoacid:ferredoxin oxidoreductase subunit beta [Ichthyobacteriaceae bacterium]
MELEKVKYTYKDFSSDQEVKWCPGCGDYAILNAVQKAMPEMPVKKEDFVFISGIGCSSRFPYYMNTYGFHSIHGRGLAIATGTKLANPNLSVWQITGDGDALAIGGNHFIHAVRRNVDLNVILFNNEIYGLTKGQFSPTTKLGMKTKTSPEGQIQNPFNPGELVMGAKGRFFARVMDKKPKHMKQIFIEAEKFKGTSVVEALTNCVIFNDKIHDQFTHKTNQQNMLFVEHGKPMLFGSEKQYGLMLHGFKLIKVELGVNHVTIDDILVHDAHVEETGLGIMLVNAGMNDGLPRVFGVIRAVQEDTFEVRMQAQVDSVRENTKYNNLDDLFASGETWEIK